MRPGLSAALVIAALATAPQLALAACPGGITAPPGLTPAQKREMYANISTAPSYVRVSVHETRTGDRVDMIFENADFQRYLESTQGISREAYPRFMLENEGRVFDVDLEKFAQILARWRFSGRGRVTRATFEHSFKYLRDGTIASAATLEDYGVCDADALVRKYFVFDAERGMGKEKAEERSPETHEPHFIGLLMDHGYVVVRGEMPPRLYIYRLQ